MVHVLLMETKLSAEGCDMLFSTSNPHKRLNDVNHH